MVTGKAGRGLPTQPEKTEMDEITISANSEDVERDAKQLTAALKAFNDRTVGPLVTKRLTVFARDSAGKVVGGAIGKTGWNWYHLEVMWVDEHLRGRGLGRELPQKAEDEARRRGCVAAITDSYDFQAPGFYETLGYERYGVLEGFPPGSRLNYLTKRL
jgi:GNAT superfamily N-acetyltransferase